MLEKALLWITVLLGLALAATGVKLYFAQENLKVARGTIDNYRENAAAQKREAQATLDRLTLEIGELNRRLLLAYKAQESKDETNQRTVAKLEDRLDGLLRTGGGRLRDPNGTDRCGQGSGGTTAGVPAPDTSGGQDRTEAPGLLSPALSELLQRVWRESDEINNAYASCRSQLMPQE